MPVMIAWFFITLPGISRYISHSRRGSNCFIAIALQAFNLFRFMGFVHLSVVES